MPNGERYEDDFEHEDGDDLYDDGIDVDIPFSIGNWCAMSCTRSKRLAAMAAAYTSTVHPHPQPKPHLRFAAEAASARSCVPGALQYTST